MLFKLQDGSVINISGASHIIPNAAGNSFTLAFPGVTGLVCNDPGLLVYNTILASAQ